MWLNVAAERTHTPGEPVPSDDMKAPHPNSVCWAWDAGDPRMIAGAADCVVVAVIDSVRRVDSNSLRAEIPVEDSDEVHRISHDEYRADVRVLEFLKGSAAEPLQVRFPPELVLSSSDPSRAPVRSRQTYVLGLTRADAQLSALPGCGILAVDDPDDEVRANDGLVSDSRGRQHELMPVAELMQWAVNNAVPFKDGMPDPGASRLSPRGV